jgi:hypothetical protein
MPLYHILAILPVNKAGHYCHRRLPSEIYFAPLRSLAFSKNESEIGESVKVMSSIIIFLFEVG